MKIYNKTLLKVVVIFICLYTNFVESTNFDDIEYDEDDCEYNIHRKCNVDQDYSEDEIEKVRLYLIERFAITNPKGKPCAKLQVRKDIKCLTEKELEDFVFVFKKLYENGVVDNYAYLHNEYWPNAHKFLEGPSWHKWFGVQFEKEMQKINPNVTLHYWEDYSEFKGAEKSSVWKYFGHAGNQNNDYVVTDGLFANTIVNNPDSHYVRREWNEDGTIPIWEGPEWHTATLQMGTIPILVLRGFLGYFLRATTSEDLLRLIQTMLYYMSSNCGPIQLYNQFITSATFSGHFKHHLAMGGYNGDLSVSTAPNDVIFWLFHAFFDIELLKWQLQNDKNLVPLSYNFGFKLDYKTKNISLANIATDKLSFYESISVKETFQQGYGDLCYIYDRMIKPINDIINCKEPELPSYVKRLKEALPPEKFELYFPKFALNEEYVNYFDYLLPDVGNCNPRGDNGVCKKMPIADRYNATLNGMRQLNRFKYDANFDNSGTVLTDEQFYEQFVNDLNAYNYCSPYV